MFTPSARLISTMQLYCFSSSVVKNGTDKRFEATRFHPRTIISPFPARKFLIYYPHVLCLMRKMLEWDSIFHQWPPKPGMNYPCGYAL